MTATRIARRGDLWEQQTNHRPTSGFFYMHFKCDPTRQVKSSQHDLVAEGHCTSSALSSHSCSPRNKIYPCHSVASVWRGQFEVMTVCMPANHPKGRQPLCGQADWSLQSIPAAEQFGLCPATPAGSSRWQCSHFLLHNFTAAIQTNVLLRL